MKKHLLSILFLLILIKIESGQCIPEKLFSTKDIGTFDDHLNFHMNFHIDGDSVNGYSGYNYKINTNPFFQIILIENPACKWNNDFTVGETSFSALVAIRDNPAKPAIFKIVYKKMGLNI